jgi:hypothetical protein
MSGKSQPKTHAIKISEATYQDLRSLALESDILRVTILPDYESKMASLLHKTGSSHNPHGGGNTYELEQALGEDVLLRREGIPPLVLLKSHKILAGEGKHV